MCARSETENFNFFTFKRVKKFTLLHLNSMLFIINTKKVFSLFIKKIENTLIYEIKCQIIFAIT